MKKYKLRNHGRKKAFVGESIVAAGVSGAFQLAAAGLQTAATKEAAKEQAEATLNAAKQQADALKEQNQNANDLQEKNIEFTKEQNAEMRRTMLASQLNSQMGAASGNADAAIQANRITAKKGKYIRNISSLRGSAGISVTDGGVAIPIGNDGTGEIYLMKGDKHSESHIAPDGRRKTGIGIRYPKFTNKSGTGILEVQDGELVKSFDNGNTGVLSTNNIAGVNPAKTVLRGGDFNTMLQYQEMTKKDRKNIGRRKADFGYNYPNSYAGFRNKYNNGNTFSFDDSPLGMFNLQHPQYLQQYNAKTIVGKSYTPTLEAKMATFDAQNPQYALKYNMNKTKSDIDNINTEGHYNITNDNINMGPETYEDFLSRTGGPLEQQQTTQSNDSESGSGWSNFGMAAAQAGVNGLFNAGGALISHLGNNAAARITSDANIQAGDLMANAYRNLKTIDPNIISSKDTQAQHAMANFRAPVISTNRQWTENARMRDNLLANSRRGSVSSAASFARNRQANVAFMDTGNQIEDQAEAKREQVRQANTKMGNQVAMFNAQQDNQSKKDYINQKLALAQYNNDIINERILGEANYLANAKTGSAQALAGAKTANAQSWASALVNTGNTGINAFNAYEKYYRDFLNALSTQDEDVQKYIMQHLFDENGRRRTLRQYRRSFNS